MNCFTAEAIQLRAVSAAHGALPALHEITASVPEHAVTALSGHNGSGKSTMLAVLAGVHAPAAGRLRRFHAHRPALVAQRSAVPDALPITVRETVNMGRWAHCGFWRRLSKQDHFIVESCMDRLGIRELANRRLGSLSGGQRQRTLLAQGLAQQSDLLLLDEPAAGLDAEAQASIADLLTELGEEGVTVVHATHDLDAAARADHWLCLAHGRLVTAEAPARTLVPGGSASDEGASSADTPKVRDDGARLS